MELGYLVKAMSLLVIGSIISVELGIWLAKSMIKDSNRRDYGKD
jgi:hypothetical protein